MGKMELGAGRPEPGPAPAFYYSNAVPVLDDLVHSSLSQFSYEDLKMFTDDFSDDNFIVRTQFCRVYRGKISNASHSRTEEEEQVVTVKVWADSVDWPRSTEKERCVNFAGNFERCKDEVKFLTTGEFNTHPNSVKLMGLCCDIENEYLAVVYNLNSYDTLRNLIPGEFLKWADRINIALKLASFLEPLHKHQPPLLVVNISAAHIMIDQDLNPFLLDFGMLTTKYHMERLRFPFGAYGYQDRLFLNGWGEWTDVFGLGVVLMEMLSMRTIDDGVKEFEVRKPSQFNHYAAHAMYESLREEKWKVSKWLLVAESFVEDAEFNHHDGDLLTILALECITDLHTPRPTITAVISRLKCLYLLGGSKSDPLMPVEDAPMPVKDDSIIKKMKKMVLKTLRKKK